MRTIQCVRAGWLAAAVSVCTLIGGAALAATSTERPGSILIFPKVVTSGTRDTVIQITNTGNTFDDLRCFYLNGQSCFETDFVVSLTKQQPTVWRAGVGRPVNPIDGQKGLDPGLIPPLPLNFMGALICVEVDTSDAPVPKNQIKGEATLVDHSGTSTGSDVSKYNAVAIPGFAGQNNGDNTLKLNDGEYGACPASLVLNFQRDGGPDPIIEALGNGGRCSAGSSSPGAPCNSDNVPSDCPGGSCQDGQSRIATRLTVLPCMLDIAGLTKTKVSLHFQGKDEAEANFSGGRTFSCWDSFTVDRTQIGVVATPNLTMNIRGDTPVFAVAEVFHSDSIANTASSAVNLHGQGLCSTGPLTGSPCNRNADCNPGTTTGNTCSADFVAGTTITIPEE